MPKVKLSGVKARESSSGFEPYDGPIPTQKGFYRAALKKVQFGKNNSGSYGFFIVAELEAAPGDPKGHAQYDGYPLFIRNIITQTSSGDALKEGSIRNLENFLAALGTKDEPDIITAQGDPDEQFLDVTKIGTRNPIGAIVNIDLGQETYEGEKRPSANGIYKLKDESAGKSSRSKAAVLDEPEDEDEDLYEEPDDEEFDEEAEGYSEEELNGMTLAELRAAAKELEIDTKGLKKADLVAAILEADEADEADDEDEPDDEDEDEIDPDEADDEEDEEDEEDEDDEAEAERREELSGLNRVALKKILAGIAPKFVPLKRHSDDDLREQIIEIEFGDEETPF